MYLTEKLKSRVLFFKFKNDVEKYYSVLNFIRRITVNLKGKISNQEIKISQSLIHILFNARSALPRYQVKNQLER